MPIVSSSPTPVILPDASPAPIAPAVDPAFEERWAAWVARGDRHDRALRRKVRFAALAVAIVVAIVVALRVFGAL